MWVMNTLTKLAVGAVMVVAVATIGVVLFADDPSVGETPVGSPQALPSPSVVATSGPIAGPIRRWPDTTKNQAGVYSWDASPYPRFPGNSAGFMQNTGPGGSGGVRIIFVGVPGLLKPDRGGIPITVAGYEGTYKRRIWERVLPEEVWRFDIQGTTVAIHVVKGNEARESEMIEAHEIIDSIRVEPQDNSLGFRLVFTLPTDTWVSTY
jgi:hypothetical protein